MTLWIEWKTSYCLKKISANLTSDKGLVFRIHKESQNSKVGKQAIQLENGQKTWNNIPLKNFYEWQTSTYKDVQYH